MVDICSSKKQLRRISSTHVSGSDRIRHLLADLRAVHYSQAFFRFRSFVSVVRCLHESKAILFLSLAIRDPMYTDNITAAHFRILYYLWIRPILESLFSVCIFLAMPFIATWVSALLGGPDVTGSKGVWIAVGVIFFLICIGTLFNLIGYTIHATKASFVDRFNAQLRETTGQSLQSEIGAFRPKDNVHCLVISSDGSKLVCLTYSRMLLAFDLRSRSLLDCHRIRFDHWKTQVVCEADSSSSFLFTLGDVAVSYDLHTRTFCQRLRDRRGLTSSWSGDLLFTNSRQQSIEVRSSHPDKKVRIAAASVQVPDDLSSAFYPFGANGFAYGFKTTVVDSDVSLSFLSKDCTSSEKSQSHSFVLPDCAKSVGQFGCAHFQNALGSPDGLHIVVVVNTEIVERNSTARSMNQHRALWLLRIATGESNKLSDSIKTLKLADLFLVRTEGEGGRMFDNPIFVMKYLYELHTWISEQRKSL